jgi:hypothetical protein
MSTGWPVTEPSVTDPAVVNQILTRAVDLGGSASEHSIFCVRMMARRVHENEREAHSK